MKGGATALPTIQPATTTTTTTTTTPASCDIQLQKSVSCKDYVKINGCVYTITLEVSADNTPNTVIVNSNTPDKAIADTDTVSSDLFTYEVTPNGNGIQLAAPGTLNQGDKQV